MCRTLSVMLAFLLSTASWMSDVAATPQPDSCPEHKPLVVNAFATFHNVVDEGLDGHVWALNSRTQYIQIRR